VDIQGIATAAMALLGPYLAKAGGAFSEKSGEELAEKVGALQRAIKSKFKGDTYAEQTLTWAEEKPQLKDRQGALPEVLTETMEGDQDFAETIRRLVQEGKRIWGSHIIAQYLEFSGKSGDVFQMVDIQRQYLQDRG